MKDRYIPAFITLCAGAIVSIMDIINKVDITSSMKRLLLVLVIFYIIGMIARAIIVKVQNMNPKTELNEVDSEGNDSEETPSEDKF